MTNKMDANHRSAGDSDLVSGVIETTYQIVRTDANRPAVDPPEKQASERRQFARRRLALVVHLRFPTVDAVVESRTIDISRSGVFLATSEIRPVGTPVRITFTVENRQLVVYGVVVRLVLRAKSTNGMAIAFDRPVADDSGLFEQLLQERSARAAAERRARELRNR